MFSLGSRAAQTFRFRIKLDLIIIETNRKKKKERKKERKKEIKKERKKERKIKIITRKTRRRRRRRRKRRRRTVIFVLRGGALQCHQGHSKGWLPWVPSWAP